MANISKEKRQLRRNLAGLAESFDGLNDARDANDADEVLMYVNTLWSGLKRTVKLAGGIRHDAVSDDPDLDVPSEYSKLATAIAGVQNAGDAFCRAATPASESALDAAIAAADDALEAYEKTLTADDATESLDVKA